MALPTLTAEQKAYNRLPYAEQQKVVNPSTPRPTEENNTYIMTPKAPTAPVVPAPVVGVATPTKPAPTVTSSVFGTTPSNYQQGYSNMGSVSNVVAPPPVAPAANTVIPAQSAPTVITPTTAPTVTSKNQYDFTQTPQGNVGVPELLPPVDNRGTLQKAEDSFVPSEYEKQLQADLQATKQELQNYIKSNTNDNAINVILKDLKDWKGQFSTKISDLITQTLVPFNYDVNNDTLLADAIKYADKSMMDEMDKRGIFTSTITRDNMVNIRSELMPKYQALALERYNSNIDRMFKSAEFMNKIDQQDLTNYTNYASAAINQLEKVDAKTIKSFETVIDTIAKQVTTNENAKKDQATAYRDIYAKALDALDKFGYVTNDIAPILGLPVGTPSSAARLAALTKLEDANKALIQHGYRIEEINQTAKNTKENNIAVAKTKAEEEKTKDKQKANVGYYLSQLSGTPAEEAIKEISSGENLQKILEATGGDGYQELVKQLETRKQKEIDNKISEDTNVRNEKTSVRNAEAAERSAKAAERTAKAAEGKISTQDFNKSFGEDFSTLKAMSYDDAWSTLKENSSDLIAVYGPNGYKDLYNKVLNDAFYDPAFNAKILPLD
jgi:hypothetical protein